jgi:hypothetical protein
MGFGKRKVPVSAGSGHPLAGEMPLGQLPLEEPRPEAGASPDTVQEPIPVPDPSGGPELPLPPLDEPSVDAGRALPQPDGGRRPFSLIPECCWDGRSGALLTERLRLSRHDDWNVVHLPADQATAEALNLPPHPGGDVPAFVEAAQDFLAKAERDLGAALEEAEKTGDAEPVMELTEALIHKVKTLARKFLGEMDLAWENRARSRETSAPAE